MSTPAAEQLKGMKLDNGWTVLKEATRKPNATGGHFSKGYVVEHSDGRRGFLRHLITLLLLNQASTHPGSCWP